MFLLTEPYLKGGGETRGGQLSQEKKILSDLRSGNVLYNMYRQIDD